jgi:hypothetical protein
MQAAHANHEHHVWWDEPDSGWERVKEAFRRDWEQTKADFGAKAPDLDQNVGDTVKQALGKEPIPPPDVPNRLEERWENVEHAIRYGYAARQKFGEQKAWDDEVETHLRQDWDTMSPPNAWHTMRPFVQRGWMGP